VSRSVSNPGSARIRSSSVGTSSVGTSSAIAVFKNQYVKNLKGIVPPKNGRRQEQSAVIELQSAVIELQSVVIEL
jgi:hypothetical protein